MGEEETITVAEVSEGADTGTPVELPAVEVLTGRAFLTGKSGSGKSNTASVVVEKLLDRGFGVLIVDIEGEYYGLKEEYEILHAGADEECDIRVSAEHADKLASLALEQNVPIILDLSGFLHEEEAKELLTAVARRLFAKAKKVKQPFLVVVEEIHEYVPEGGGLDECGRMLIKVAKRGRKHGLGVAGISQRPADVKKDFITQCDWLVWHRLTWRNDTRVVKRVVGAEYAEAVEDLDDGEGFLMTDWGEDLRRVQFQRKRTFDAGATPGLEDFERPDLKSVSDDLVSELQQISEEQARREADVARLENELHEREQRIAELEEELAEARDLSRMAEQFARAMTRQVEGHDPPTDRTELPDYAAEGSPTDEDDGEDGEEDADGGYDHGGVHDAVTPEQRAIIEDAAAAASGATPGEESAAVMSNGTGDAVEEGAGTAAAEDGSGTAVAGEDGSRAEVADGSEPDTGAADFVPCEGERTREDGEGAAAPTGPDPAAQGPRSESGDAGGGDAFLDVADPGALAEQLRQSVDTLDERPREMLACYRDVGIATPEAVHEAAGGSGERAAAYGHNRTLRKRGFVVHVGGGRYAYALPSLLEALAGGLGDDDRAHLLARAEAPL